jgi:nicotinamide-nucleotide amidase
MGLVFIGKEFKYRNFLQNYILEKYKADKIYFFDNIDFQLESLINENNQILIVTNETLYSTTSKILATLNEDTLELKNGYLLPTKTIMYEKNSFLLDINDTIINLIKVTDYIPNILLHNDYYTFHIFNYDLETTNMFIKPIFDTFNIDYSLYMNEGGWCEIKTTKINENLIKQLKGFIPHVIIHNNIFEYLKDKLENNNQKITFAESCTGGLISSAITKIPGSSKVFDGSIISYANRIKSEWLGVDERVLAKFGAVSEEVVQQMLLGILEVSNSDYAIAVSGIAGPSGGSEYKPVGTVFIGVGDKNGKFIVERLNLNGDRLQVQYQTLMHSIRLFIKFFNFL